MGQMLPEKIILADLSIDLIHAWAKAFPAHDRLELHKGDFFARSADAMVSPGNSFGFMDRGLDAAICAVLGHGAERRVQKTIVDRYHGELPVGAAIVVATEHERWPYLVVAPTMRIPERVGDTLNADLAFRAALLAVRDHNIAQPASPIRTLLVPGLATGVGGMLPGRCAEQMRVAYDEIAQPARIPSASAIRATHAKLRSAV
jgi:O-acetyl-ADP-ribose deacetylase (regulator of RNase III)